MKPDPTAEGRRWFAQAERDSARYPNGVAYGSLPYEAYDAEDAAKAIRMAREALEFVRVRLQRGPGRIQGTL